MTIIPPPKCASTLPVAPSNLKMMSSGLRAPVAASEMQLLAPHRSTAQTLLPSRSISTRLVEPQVRPSGSGKKFSTV
jgi:hypothetical protein